MTRETVPDREEKIIALEDPIAAQNESAVPNGNISDMMASSQKPLSANLRVGILVLDENGYLVPVVTAADLLYECKRRWRATLY
jgi:hypothetical protein